VWSFFRNDPHASRVPTEEDALERLVSKFWMERLYLKSLWEALIVAELETRLFCEPPPKSVEGHVT
jgi:hypothetical protein